LITWGEIQLNLPNNLQAQKKISPQREVEIRSSEFLTVGCASTIVAPYVGTVSSEIKEDEETPTF